MGEVGTPIAVRRGRLRASWRAFLEEADVTVPRLLAALPAPIAAQDDTPDVIATYLAEGPVALDLVAPHLAGPSRILEVGSGIGVVSRFLAAQGHEVVATEPAPDGFDRMHGLADAVDTVCGPLSSGGGLRRLDLGVDDLDPTVLGTFDLVFSANVLEHVPDPARAVLHLQRFLGRDGVQVHVCPNYALPYDPHIRRPLVPLVPRVTRWLLPSGVRESPEFRSVNFVTARRIRRAVQRSGRRIRFERGLLAAAVERFGSDPAFADRHGGLAPIVRAVGTLGVGRLLALVPPGLASPMRFSVEGDSSDG